MNQSHFMSAAEYRVILDRLGLDHAAAARLPGIFGKDSEAWAEGTEVVPGDVAKVLRELARSGITPELVRMVVDDA